MPTGFVRDKAEGGKSGSVAPLRHPAAHVPCSLAARSASSKKRVEECLRQEVYEKALTPARGGKKCSRHPCDTIQSSGNAYAKSPFLRCDLALITHLLSRQQVSREIHHWPLRRRGPRRRRTKFALVFKDGGGVISGIAVEGGDSIRGKS
uniref:Uncharacterized protein n=1 Tax=Oryza glaberrima TaxID=4538 RepID=I1PEC4_ORYGL